MRVLKTITGIVSRHKFILSTLLATLVIPAALFAWGPNRPTFTIEKPATYVTFNSITNNPNYGDERNFVLTKKVSEPSSTWRDSVDEVENGEEYYVRTYVHNNAAANLNLVAENVKASAVIPGTVGKQTVIQGKISSSNANPGTIWDEAYFKNSKYDFAMNYVPGSATYLTNAGKFSLPDSITTNGATLGYDKLDGKIPGCFQYSGIVMYKVKAIVNVPKTPNFSISKTVNGQENIQVQKDEQFNYEITVKNTGDTDLSNIIVKDKQPTDVKFISADKGTISSEGVFSYTIPSLKVGASETINIKAKATADNLSRKNTACAATGSVDNGNPKCDDANIVTPGKPALTCDLLIINKLDRNKFEFDTKYTVSNTEFTGTKYVIKDASGKVVAEKTVNNGTKLTFTSEQTGKFTVTATILTKDGNATSEKCSASFEITPELKPGVSIDKTVNGKENITIEANKEFTYELVVKNTGEVDLKDVLVTDKAPENVKFISADKGTIKDNSFSYTIPTLKVGESETIKITAKATKSGISAKNTACVETPTVPGGNPDDCDDANIETPDDKPSIKIEKTVNGEDKITIEKDKEFDYKITVTNTGNIELKDAVVTDKAPEHIQFISASAGEIKDNTWTTKIVSLKPGESETYTIKAKATATGVNTKNTACVDTPTIPGNPDDCDEAEVEVPGEKCEVPGKEHLKPNDPECKPETPVNPPTNPGTPSNPEVPGELPTTGPAEVLSAVAGIGSLTAATGYYVASRKKL